MYWKSIHLQTYTLVTTDPRYVDISILRSTSHTDNSHLHDTALRTQGSLL